MSKSWNPVMRMLDEFSEAMREFNNAGAIIDLATIDPLEERPNEEELDHVFDTLFELARCDFVRVVGRTAYRTASVGDVILRCNRERIKFLEDRLGYDKDNHTVLIFQVLTITTSDWQPTYYAFLSDSMCVIGTSIITRSF